MEKRPKKHTNRTVIMDKERKMTDTILLKQEIVIHEKLSDGRIRVTRTVQRKVSDSSDRMSQSNEVEFIG